MIHYPFFRTGLLVFTALLLSFVACKPKDGEVGPQGATGPAGPAGPKGDPGTANVVYSAWTNVTFSGSGTSYTGNFNATQLTQEVIDKADIRSYMKDGSRIISVPYAQVIGSTTYTIHPRYYVGRIEYAASYALATLQFRFVIIPGGTLASRKAAVDLDDYNAVKAYYNLPD